MARAINRLTARTVQTLQDHGRHADGAGLYLVVDAAGKRWAVFFPWRGRRREMGLGAYPAVSLVQARQAAREAREAAAAGTDPIAARKALQRGSERPTLGEAATELIDSLKAGWRGEHTASSWERSFTLYAKSIRDRPVDTINTDDVLSVLRPIWSTKPETAGKLRERLERVLDAARAKGDRPADSANPARWKGHLALLLPSRPKLVRGHMAAMPWREVPAFMAALRERSGMSARALEWTILTAGREAMTLRADHAEIEGEVWIVPAARMKDGREHRVPLVPAMFDVLARSGTVEGLLFPAQRGGPMSNTAMDKMLAMIQPGLTVHGFRSSFRDWAGDETDHPREVIEAALSHVVGDATERAYRRSDALAKRRALMADWAAFVMPPFGDAPQAEPGRPLE